MNKIDIRDTLWVQDMLCANGEDELLTALGELKRLNPDRPAKVDGRTIVTYRVLTAGEAIDRINKELNEIQRED